MFQPSASDSISGLNQANDIFNITKWSEVQQRKEISKLSEFQI